MICEIDKDRDSIVFKEMKNSHDSDDIYFINGELGADICTDNGNYLEIELSKEETKELYEFMKGYYEKETT
jgi:hypothetical protein